MSFLADTPVTGPRSLPRGYPMMGYLLPGQVPDRGDPWRSTPGQVRSQTGVTLVPGQHGVLTWPGMGHPPQPGQDGVLASQPGKGYPPHRLCLDRLCRRRYVSCGFPKEDFIVLVMFYMGMSSFAITSFCFIYRISQFSKSHILQTFMFVVEFVIGYLLMLTVMTYNAWLFLSVIVGSAIGYSACSFINLKHKFQITTTQTASNRNEKRENESEDLEEKIEMLNKATEVKE